MTEVFLVGHFRDPHVIFAVFSYHCSVVKVPARDKKSAHADSSLLFYHEPPALSPDVYSSALHSTTLTPFDKGQFFVCPKTDFLIAYLRPFEAARATVYHVI